MSYEQSGSGETGLETVVSYLLMAGVIASLLLETAGIILYYLSYGNLSIEFSKLVTIQGHDFFSFMYHLLRGEQNGGTAIRLITTGIVVLIMTPFIRVVFSVLYFAWEKNLKYALITLFVLVALTASLILH